MNIVGILSILLIVGCSINLNNSSIAVKHQLEPDSKEIYGKRFEIKGDFDGDGSREKLIEHYFDAESNKEVAKFIEGMEDATRTFQISPFSFMLSEDGKIDTLKIASGTQVSGVLFIKNEGDLNGDNSDEISYVIHWSDWSSLNTWHIVTYRKNKWEELLTFPITEFQLDRMNGSLVKNLGLNSIQITFLNDESEGENKTIILN